MRPWIAIAFVLSFATWLVQARPERFEPAGPQLLVDPEFAHGFTGWKVRGRGAGRVEWWGREVGLTLTGCVAKAPKSTCEATLIQAVPYTGTDPVEIKAELLGGGATAGLFVTDRDARDLLLSPTWQKGRTALAAPFTSGWREHRSIIRPRTGTASLDVRVVNIGTDGTLGARSPSARRVRERPLFVALTAVLKLGWAGYFAAIAFVTSRRAQGRRLPGTALVAAVVVILAALGPLQELAPTQAERAPTLQGASAEASHADPPPWLPLVHALRTAIPSDDAGHVGMFLFLSVVTAAAWPASPRLALATRLLGFAAVTEVLQWFTTIRAPEVRDLAADSLGIGVGLALQRGWEILRKH